MVGQQIHRLSRGWELGQGNEMHHLREPVDHGHDGVVAPGGGETGDKIQGNVRPWPTGMGKGRRSPSGGRWDALLREQMSQAATNSRVSESRWATRNDGG